MEQTGEDILRLPSAVSFHVSRLPLAMLLVSQVWLEPTQCGKLSESLLQLLRQWTVSSDLL